MKSKHILILGIVFALLGLLAGIYLNPPKPETPRIQGLLWPNPKSLNHFELHDHNARIFNLQNLQGKWSLLFFGYTHCPDVCPATLALLNQVEQLLTEKQYRSDRQTIFVSVDSERDSSKQLKDYVTYFNPGFIGLSGSNEKLQDLTQQLGILAMRVEQDNGDYLMDHSASILLIGPTGQLIAIFSAPHDINDITTRYMQIVDFITLNS